MAAVNLATVYNLDSVSPNLRTTPQNNPIMLWGVTQTPDNPRRNAL